MSLINNCENNITDKIMGWIPGFIFPSFCRFFLPVQCSTAIWVPVSEPHLSPIEETIVQILSSFTNSAATVFLPDKMYRFHLFLFFFYIYIAVICPPLLGIVKPKTFELLTMFSTIYSTLEKSVFAVNNFPCNIGIQYLQSHCYYECWTFDKYCLLRPHHQNKVLCKDSIYNFKTFFLRWPTHILRS